MSGIIHKLKDAIHHHGHPETSTSTGTHDTKTGTTSHSQNTDNISYGTQGTGVHSTEAGNTTHGIHGAESGNTYGIHESAILGTDAADTIHGTIGQETGSSSHNTTHDHVADTRSRNTAGRGLVSTDAGVSSEFYKQHRSPVSADKFFLTEEIPGHHGAPLPHHGHGHATHTSDISNPSNATHGHDLSALTGNTGSRTGAPYPDSRVDNRDHSSNPIVSEHAINPVITDNALSGRDAFTNIHEKPQGPF